MKGASGAGGNWKVVDEISDPNVVKQRDAVSCGIACGEMLLRDRGIYNVNQSIIAAETGTPVSPEILALVLNTLDYSISHTGEVH